MAYMVVLTFKSLDKILKCNHFNETCEAVIAIPWGFVFMVYKELLSLWGCNTRSSTWLLWWANYGDNHWKLRVWKKGMGDLLYQTELLAVLLFNNTFLCVSTSLQQKLGFNEFQLLILNLSCYENKRKTNKLSKYTSTHFSCSRTWPSSTWDHSSAWRHSHCSTWMNKNKINK